MAAARKGLEGKGEISFGSDSREEHHARVLGCKSKQGSRFPENCSPWYGLADVARNFFGRDNVGL
jgi:hypothetical protein